MGFYIGKTKRRLHDKKHNTSATTDQVKTIGRNIKWYNFDDILAKGKADYHCKINETLFIQEL